MSDRNDAWDGACEQYIETLEAKLAVAREALQYIYETSDDDHDSRKAFVALQEIGND